jgi:hypothetical protein
MMQRRLRRTGSFLIPLVGVALALTATQPALGKGKGGGGSPCDGLDNLADGDFDGLGNLQDCQGLAEKRNEVAFTYPGCMVDADAAATGNCTRHDVADIFVEFHKDTDHANGSAYDDDFGGLGPISNEELFSAAEASAGVNFHVFPPGSFLAPGVRPRGVTLIQSGIILTENRDLAYSRDSAGALVCPENPPSNGVTTQGNPNESGNPRVNSQRVFDRVDCIYENLAAPGNFEEKRDHLINSAIHETFHSLEQAPDPIANHMATGAPCLMATAPVVNRKGDLVIPLVFCEPTLATMQAGATSQTAPASPEGAPQTGTICGDNTTYDDGGLPEDSIEPCLTAPTPPAP